MLRRHNNAKEMPKFRLLTRRLCTYYYICDSKNLETSVIIFFPGVERPGRSQHRRRRAHCRPSLHNYRRALARRFGLCGTSRPACVLDTLARELLAARVA
jgi:hypothetical protein